MKKVLEQLASLKLAIVLLVLLLVGLSAGTIIESSRGAEVAQRTVYYAWWFLALQGVFAANLLASIATLFPWGKARVGYLLTHGSLALIFLGATMTYFLKTEGQLALWEGQHSNAIDEFGRDGAPSSSTQLPFFVKLDDFEVETLPGHDAALAASAAASRSRTRRSARPSRSRSG